MARRKVMAGCQSGIWCRAPSEIPRYLLESHHLIPSEWQKVHPEEDCKIKGGRQDTILVCRNCHGEIHEDMRRKFGKSISEADENEIYAYANDLRGRLRY